MKKSLIAASASAVALAAMPVVGVFATDNLTQTDTLKITISDVCSLGYTSEGQAPDIDVPAPSHTPGDGSWGSEATANILSKTMITGTATQNLGKTTLAVYCNNENGYEISAGNAGALTGVTNGDTPVAITDTIPVASNFSASNSGWSYMVEAKTGTEQAPWTQRGVVKNDHGNWAAATAEGNTPAANGVIAGSPTAAPKTTLNTGDFFIITYGVGVDQTQSAGTYTGSITYTLAALNSN